MADASLVAGTAGTVDVVMNLEGAFTTDEVIDGDQMVFGRIRIRAKGAANGTYRITHPYGIDEFVVTDGAGINSTEDIGTVRAAFGDAMRSRVGPFLTWDTFGRRSRRAAGRLHRRPRGRAHDQGQPLRNQPRAGRAQGRRRRLPDHRHHDRFLVQGRLARNGGVDVQQATYRTMDDGTTVVEVFASSEDGQAIRMIAPELGYKGITLEEDDFTVQVGASSHQEGHYYGRFAVKPGVAVTGGADATKIVIQNAGDVPVSSKTVSLSDVVTVTDASYDGATLTIAANSSDPAATLTVKGYGDRQQGQPASPGSTPRLTSSP